MTTSKQRFCPLAAQGMIDDRRRVIARLRVFVPVMNDGGRKGPRLGQPAFDISAIDIEFSLSQPGIENAEIGIVELAQIAAKDEQGFLMARHVMSQCFVLANSEADLGCL